ncbi:MAG: hypothetical protein K2Y02_10975 [Burkholderiaceae bacterium]|nr:hypothetical protein [Accumulibacter sp.]MBX9794809.1 hypothetical protein [Burkholderiaceae bacterium]
MRKLIFIGFVVVGTILGLVLAASASWGARLVVMSFGALAGAAVGGSVSGIGKRGRAPQLRDGALRGLGTTSEDLMDNYWRDEGHPQFMKPPSPDNKQFGGSDGMTD